MRIGTVSSVDVANGTAYVAFADKDGMVSGALKVLQNQPVIAVENRIESKKWDCTASYATVDRKLGIGETYTKSLPDIITNKSPANEITYAGEIRAHTQEIKVYPWLPYIGQMVVCLFLPNGDGDGFIIGGF